LKSKRITNNTELKTWRYEIEEKEQHKHLLKPEITSGSPEE